MANSGLFLHLVVMLVVAAVAYLSIVTIARAERYKTYHFSDLIVLALGRNCDRLYHHYLHIRDCNQVLVGKFVPSILGSLTLHVNFQWKEM